MKGLMESEKDEKEIKSKINKIFKNSQESIYFSK